MMHERKKVGVALSGGVARGAAHIGVLEVLTQAGIPIDYLAGASAGAMVGASFCAGVGIERMLEMSDQVNWLKLATLTWPRHGVLSFAPLENQILDSLGDIHIEDLLIPMAVVATDLATFRTVVIREGCLARAVRASCSVPGIVTPVEIDGRMLADGGASNNMPAQITRDMGAEYVIGVDLFQPSPFHKGGPVGGTITMIERFVEMSGGGFEGADYVITPKLSGKSYLRFSQSRKMVELGREAARAALPDLRRELAECGITCREVH